MISRRQLVAGGVVLITAPLAACVTNSESVLAGSMQQGSLIVGRTVPGARVRFDELELNVSPGGEFVCGLDWKRRSAAEILFAFPDGTEEVRRVFPLVRQYSVETVNGLPPDTVTPPADVLDRIRHESQTIFHARQKDSDLCWFGDPFDWPAPGILSGVFGSERIDNGKPMSPHMGVDMANVEGTPIRAPANATVSISDDYYLDGGFTLLDHGHGVSTCYLHQSKRLVQQGDVVRRGEVIGLMGKTGRATGPHLHWAMNWFQVKLDPSLSTQTPVPPRI